MFQLKRRLSVLMDLLVQNSVVSVAYNFVLVMVVEILELIRFVVVVILRIVAVFAVLVSWCVGDLFVS